MTYPTQGRLFGVVRIDTSKEARVASDSQNESGEFLKIQVTRDRLVANQPYLLLQKAVRWSLDYYATRQRLREQERVEIIRPDEPFDEKLGRIRSLVMEACNMYPDDDTLVELAEEFDGFSNEIDKERKADEAATFAPWISCIGRNGRACYGA